MRVAGVIAWLMALGCSSDDGGQPESCDPEKDRVGTYIVSYVERSGGDCGPIEDSVVRLGAGPAPGGGTDCVLLAEPALSEGNCKLEQTVECTLPDGSVGTSHVVTTQMDEAGSLLRGVLDLTGTDASGGFICHSVYDVTYRRQ